MNKRLGFASVLAVIFIGQTPAFSQVVTSPRAAAAAATLKARSLEAAQQLRWRADVAQQPVSGEGCFHASYPDLVWQSVDCGTAAGVAASAGAAPAIGGGTAPLIGQGAGYVAQAHGLISYATGNFAISHVTSEEGVATDPDVIAIVGPDEYTLQLNTNADATTNACAGATGLCTVWQQFIYSTDYPNPGEGPKVYMQSWLHNWLSDVADHPTHPCPPGFSHSDVNCFKNSPLVTAPLIPVSDLDKLTLEGSFIFGLTAVTLEYGTEAYRVLSADVLEMGSHWQQAEFNVFGNGGDSEAVFNPGASITVKLSEHDGSTLAPLCRSEGTSGELNNLSLSTGCVPSVQTDPTIQFTESRPDIPVFMYAQMPSGLLSLSLP